MRVRFALACLFSVLVSGCMGSGAAFPARGGSGTAPLTAESFSQTLPPGSQLPSDSVCAARVHPAAENKRMNRVYNATKGRQGLGKHFFPTSDDPRANTQIAARVDGSFTGTTDEILQWTACKWGIDVNVVRAQAATESWWRQTTEGGWTTDPSRCAPGHGLGIDDPQNHPGQCPAVWGILQNGWYYEKPSWPGIDRSTAFNADTAYAIWRTCFEGYEWWLRNQPPNSGYAAGDQWGCIGRWYSGDWHSPAAAGYVKAVRHYLRIRVWTLTYFQEP